MSDQGAPPGIIVHSIPNTAATHEDESMLNAGPLPGSGVQSPSDTADGHQDETMSDPSPPHVGPAEAAVYGYQTLKPISQVAPTDTKLGPYRPSVSSEHKVFRQTLTHLHRPKGFAASYLPREKKLWFCCACNGGSNLTAINEGCSYCFDHWRCSRCYMVDKC